MAHPPRFDEKAARRVEAVYTSPDVAGQRALILRALELRPGERVLDVGVGPGFLARELAEAAGPSGALRGIDLSPAMLELARRRLEGLPQASLQEGDALRLPFGEGEFDAAVSIQVYEYVEDVGAALAELHRVLRPGGRAAILDTDWGSLVWRAGDAARARRILEAWDEHLADPHLPRTLAARLRGAGFEILRREAIPILNPEYGPETYSVGMISLVVPFVIGRRGVTKEEAKAWAEDLKGLGERGEYFFSLNRYLFLVRKPPME
ncbi:MAG: methyltransferase domain-containing protein [Nitrospinota bacterium]